MTNEESWQWLKRLSPSLFSCKEDPKPMAVGIRSEIESQLPNGFPVSRLKRILKVWAGRDVYRENLILGNSRFGLDGKCCGKVTQDQLDKQK